RLSTQRTRGRYGIPGVGVFVWRLKAQPVTHGPAYCYESYGSSFYTFSVLGNDAPLFTRAQPEPSPEHLAGPLHVPAPIRRHALEEDIQAYYGPERSFAVWVDGWAGHPEGGLLPPEKLMVADLSEWTYRPPRDHVAIDPVRGRLAFPPRQLPRNGVWVSYHQGFSDDMGGGEYARPLTQPAGAVVYRVGEAEELTRLGEALARWREQKPRHAVVEITDSGVYVEQINVQLDEGQSLQLRAAEHTRPVLRLMDWQTSLPDALSAYGAPGSRFVLDGLLVAGRSVRCEGPLAEVTIRHCTLVPGWGLAPDCSPRRPAEPSLELTDTVARVAVERTILGSIQVSMDEVGADPVAIRIADSILDATGNELEAVGAPTWPLAHAELTILRTTVFGEIQAHAIRLAENSIFMGRIRVARRQLGCMRFCYVTPGSRTPRRYRCQPDLADEAARATLPRVEVGADARLRLGAAEEDASCLPPADSANLEIAPESSDPAPAPEQPFQLLVTVVNRGPRDASGVVVDLTGPAGDCLRPANPVGSPAELVNMSQGELAPLPAGPTLRWRVGSLAAGAQAQMKIGDLVLVGDAECPPIVEVAAAIVRHTLVGDAQSFLQPVLRRARQRVRPRFNSTRYGTPAYAQLALHCAPEITRGADDESEMGAFHDLFQPQRAANLEARLDEFVPAGTDAAIIYAS
ncbi:MAG TPA: hypothetical protein VGX50_08145, partial [Longimicrobium sp.]|nr:hypothetical protein [Longimicrobium sp.]